MSVSNDLRALLQKIITAIDTETLPLETQQFIYDMLTNKGTDPESQYMLKCLFLGMLVQQTIENGGQKHVGGGSVD